MIVIGRYFALAVAFASLVGCAGGQEPSAADASAGDAGGTLGPRDGGHPGTDAASSEAGDGYGCMAEVNGCFCTKPPAPNYTLTTASCAPYDCCYTQVYGGYTYCQCMATAGNCEDVPDQTRVNHCPP